MKNVVVLGVSGSIGLQALEAVKLNKDSLRLIGAAVNRDVSTLARVVKEFNVAYVSVSDDAARAEFASLGLSVKIVDLEELAALSEADVVLSAMVGFAGSIPAIAALKAGKTLALANKEAMITGGRLLKQAATEGGGTIIPVDSEHSAIWQCLAAGQKKDVKSLILTASGGAFRDYSAEELKKVTPAAALNHPVWKMGKKVTVDSATLMNKGFEVIEAMYLFDVPVDSIKVLEHRQSVIHSLVEFKDNTVIAALSYPDMRIPIQLALTYPDRSYAGVDSLDLAKLGQLTFAAPNVEKFPCLALAYEAVEKGESAIIALSAADEVLVDAFIGGKIAFTDIALGLRRVLDNTECVKVGNFNDILNIDRQTRQYTLSMLRGNF